MKLLFSANLVEFVLFTLVLLLLLERGINVFQAGTDDLEDLFELVTERRAQPR